MSAFSQAMVMRGCCERCCMEAKRDDIGGVSRRPGSLTLNVDDRDSVVSTFVARSASVVLGTSKPTCHGPTWLLWPSTATRTSCLPRTMVYGLAESSVSTTRTTFFRYCE